MKKKFKTLLVFIVVITGFFVIGSILSFKSSKVISGSITKPSLTINISYENFAEQISKNSMIQALPEGSILLLRFYNFNSGEREWEKSYILKKGVVKEAINKDEKADIILTIHSKYLKELTNKNFCSIIKKAKTNGDFGFETILSKLSLAWKFKSMYKYRDCLGF